MTKQELKKIWNLPMALLAGVLCILTVFSAVNAGRWDWTVQEDEVYESYLKRWEGILTEEKLLEIEEERTLLVALPEMAEDMKAAYAAKEITWEEYCAYTDELFYVQTHQAGFQKLEMDLSYLQTEEMNTGIDNLQLFFARYWNYYFQADTVDYVLLFLVFVVALRSVFVETSSRMLPMLRASKEGIAGIMSAKFWAVGLSVGGLTLLCGLLRLVCFLLYYEMPCMDGALQSLSLFSEAAWSVSLLGGALLVCVLRMIGFALLGLLVLAVSMWIGKEVIAVAVSAVCVFLPLMVKESAGWLYRCSLYGLLNGVTTMLGAAAYGSSGLEETGIVLGVCAVWGLVVFVVMRASVKK